LVAPRLIASVISFPFLAIIADMAGVSGAMIIVYIESGVTPRLFLSEIVGFVLTEDFFSGGFKTVFFGIIVSIIGCYIGMNARGGTRGVGTPQHLRLFIRLF